MRNRSRKGAPGIVEVAARAGVSAATVSRFFNSPDMVKGKTRHKIEQAANDLGYIRDRMAGAMHHGFSGTIGLIVPTIDNAIFSELIQAFSAKLLTYDRTMLIAAHGYNLSLEIGIIKSLLERRIDGIAMIGLEHQRPPLEMLATRDIPVLAAWNYRKNSPLPCVGADNFEAGFHVASYLKSLGHTDIALVFPPVDSNDRAADRLKGAFEGLGIQEEEIAPHRLMQTRYDIGEAKYAISEMLKSDPPTAIICGNDVIAQGAIYACQALKIHVPDQISIIGIGDFRGSAHMEPALTTWRLPAQEIGTNAAELLCTRMINREAGVIPRIKIESELMIRNSVKRLN